MSYISSIKFGINYLRHRMQGVTSPEEYYQKIGDDVIPSLSNNFTDPQKPLWLNLGYWEKANNYKDACEDLARLVARNACFNGNDKVLDVGFGYGEQDLLWMNEFHVDHITGINIANLHIQVANKKLMDSPYKSKITFEYGDATQLQYIDKQFSKVVALESAFHFKPRKTFFSEAYRVLQKDGVMVIADMTALQGEKINTKWKIKGRAEMFIPDENAVDKETYSNQLTAAGFKIEKVFSIAPFVYSGAKRYFIKRAAGEDINVNIKLFASDFERCKKKNLWGWAYGLSDYVIFVVRK